MSPRCLDPYGGLFLIKPRPDNLRSHPKIPARPLNARGVAARSEEFGPDCLLHWAQHSKNDNPLTGEKTVKSSDRFAACRRFLRRLSLAGGFFGRGALASFVRAAALIALTVLLAALSVRHLSPVVVGTTERREAAPPVRELRRASGSNTCLMA